MATVAEWEVWLNGLTPEQRDDIATSIEHLASYPYFAAQFRETGLLDLPACVKVVNFKIAHAPKAAG